MLFNEGIFLIIAIAIAGFIVQARLQSVFKKYSQVPAPNYLTGRDIAEKMLRDNGITDVKVTSTEGHLTDHYNPATKTVNLSESVYNSNSISAAAVAAHECGHAVQHAKAYAPLKMRSALDEMLIMGVETNLDFQYQIMRHPVFCEGKADTGFIENIMKIS